MNNLFDERMTFTEAQYKFFSLIDGQPKDVVEKIRKEFNKIVPLITKRELEMASQGWLSS